MGMSFDICAQNLKHEHLWLEFEGTRGGHEHVQSKLMMREMRGDWWSIALRIAVLVLFLENCLWSPGRTPEATCPGKGADTATLGGSVRYFFRDSYFSSQSSRGPEMKSLFDSHSQCRPHVDCRGVACLILVFHCVVVLCVCLCTRVSCVWRVACGVSVCTVFVVCVLVYNKADLTWTKR